MTDHGQTIAIYRILDAAANRASEGLRTLEDYARFALEDRFLSESAKTLRHELHAALEPITLPRRLQARAVQSDCGTEIVAAGEMSRRDLTAVVASAASRAQQALRCIEEYLKPLSPGAAARVEKLRYRSYSLAAAITLVPEQRQRLAAAKLYLLIGGQPDPQRFADLLDRLFTAGVDIVQLRDKTATDVHLFRLSQAGAAVARRHHKWFIVNDRADIAAASGAQGVHVGQDELPVEAARRVLGPDKLIGLSTHNLDQVQSAVMAGADYIGCGPTFPSPTKAFAAYAGLPFLRQAAAATTLPAYAIGGIDLENLGTALATGIHGVAISHAIASAADPAAAAAAFRQQIDQESAEDVDAATG